MGSSKGHRNDKRTPGQTLASESVPQMTEKENTEHEGSQLQGSLVELISFDSPINFKLDEMRQVAIEGDAIFGEVAAFPTGPVPQTQKPRTTPRKMILFKAAQDFSIKSAEFVNVNGNAYGLSSSRLSASKFQGRREGRQQKQEVSCTTDSDENGVPLSPSSTSPTLDLDISDD